MTKNEQVMEHLKKLVYDLGYLEHMINWTDGITQDRISDKCKQIKSVCEVMNIIGEKHFWIHEAGIKGYAGRYTDMKKRFGLFAK